MAKVVITGGSGLLGPTVIQEFLDHNYDVLTLTSNTQKKIFVRQDSQV
nr:NAD-dependent epimerase/dehydratase family protein [Bacillus sp. Marseille-P3661]